MRWTLLALVLACSPSDRAVRHALLDKGYDSIVVGKAAFRCAPRRGAYFEARDPGTGRTVIGYVCCSRAAYLCEVHTAP